MHIVDDSLQFELLSLSGEDIVLVHFWSPIVANDVWDNLTLTPEPATLSLLALGGLAMLRRRRRRSC